MWKYRSRLDGMLSYVGLPLSVIIWKTLFIRVKP